MSTNVAVVAASTDLDDFVQVLTKGIEVRRISPRALLYKQASIIIDDSQRILLYPSSTNIVDKLLNQCLKRNQKMVEITNLMEVREGYQTDGLNKASRLHKFREKAPEERCFSLIFKHPKLVCKSVDFVTDSEMTKQKWIQALKGVVSQYTYDVVTFDERLWLSKNFKKADLNHNGEINFEELWRLLKQLNLQMSESHVKKLYRKVLEQKCAPKKRGLDEAGFFELFRVLSDSPEYRSVLRSVSGTDREFLDTKTLVVFLVQKQGFETVTEVEATGIIQMYETGDDKKHIMGINGFRRLLQSRWGYIMKPRHETIFQDMDQPLCNYFINSSHNTYLTGLQVTGSATVEGYINALRRGARLLELDIFDGEDGEPQITHKHTFISYITLRDALKAIVQYAFIFSPYPLILTLENHVSPAQQPLMADIFIEILGDKLYIPHVNFGSNPLLSPNQLKNKILLRDKIHLSNTVDEDPEAKSSTQPIVHYELGKLIALPSVKLSNHLESDLRDHPLNGSPSLSESKVLTYLESGMSIAPYTATRLIKSYPKGIRQDSSNMNPMLSWIGGIQSVAMNLQTYGREMDLVNGMFSVNGNCGYVLKPQLLRNGVDPRTCVDYQPKLMHVTIICAQYLPKTENEDSDIVDPYVLVEVHGIEADEAKHRTKTVWNNGFNPVWNEKFEFRMHCPQMAILRFVAMDFDTTSMDDFIGEFSIPVDSVRAGYSHIPLNVGSQRVPDEAASIFVHVEFE